jgi:phosphatidylglycerophosphatase GEP4
MRFLAAIIVSYLAAVAAMTATGRGYSFVRQSLNVAALRQLGRTLREPSLLVPRISVKSASDLDMRRLKEEHGIRCVVFDKDQTLSLTYVDSLHSTAVRAVESSKLEFGPSGVAILSNSVGSSDDEGYQSAAETEEKMQLAVIRHARKKPDCLDEVLTHFASRLGTNIKAHEIAVVGDRVLTDVLFANLNGMLSVLVAPISIRTDHPIAVLIRGFERRVILPLLRLFGVTAK